MRKLKTFKVREIWIVKGWTYVEAVNKTEAIEKFDLGHGEFKADELDEYPIDTDWETLKEDK